MVCGSTSCGITVMIIMMVVIMVAWSLQCGDNTSEEDNGTYMCVVVNKSCLPC